MAEEYKEDPVPFVDDDYEYVSDGASYHSDDSEVSTSHENKEFTIFIKYMLKKMIYSFAKDHDFYFIGFVKDNKIKLLSSSYGHIFKNMDIANRVLSKLRELERLNENEDINIANLGVVNLNVYHLSELPESEFFLPVGEF